MKKWIVTFHAPSDGRAVRTIHMEVLAQTAHYAVESAITCLEFGRDTKNLDTTVKLSDHQGDLSQYQSTFVAPTSQYVDMQRYHRVITNGRIYDFQLHTGEWICHYYNGVDRLRTIRCANRHDRWVK